MNPLVMLVAGVAALVIAAVRTAKVELRRHAARTRARLQLAAGASQLRDGELATLHGVATPAGDALESPLSGTPCVAYAATVAIGEVRRALRRYGNRREEYGATKMCSFVLDTGAERVTVEGERVTIDMPLTPVIPEEPARSMKFAGVEDQSAVSAPYEAIVTVGANIVVSGRVVLERAEPTDGGYRDEPVRAKLVGTPEHPITIAVR